MKTGVCTIHDGHRKTTGIATISPRGIELAPDLCLILMHRQPIIVHHGGWSFRASLLATVRAPIYAQDDAEFLASYSARGWRSLFTEVGTGHALRARWYPTDPFTSFCDARERLHSPSQRQLFEEIEDLETHFVFLKRTPFIMPLSGP